MVIEVVCNWSHTAICQSLELRISAGISGQLLKSFVKYQYIFKDTYYLEKESQNQAQGKYFSS